MITFKINAQEVNFDGDPQTPALWVIRDELKLTGTKFGCGIGQCGACSIHLNGQVIRSCVTPIESVAGQSITTIEGLAEDKQLTPVQQAWIKHDVPQCGYCQSGQIMAATDLLHKNPNPSDADIIQAMSNICRCGTYVRIKKAIHDAAEMMSKGAQS
ncbi:(2Fe-2S)-binding protein [Marinicella litoralis]|uniref:Isoquinoline 1-oxidoreductase alpha subunit n=1 Tax=Marinicella litoralis TaxID=644220 RepID=A0A4R6XT47_9GAMM|nr:(2Fe-2S)-binding protein [Marinicella litoralis]TDR20603.1 isoquinoline 1-oxidoreductase alpha subunit [Marinicella litoralis]